MNSRALLWILLGVGVLLAAIGGGVAISTAWKRGGNADKWLPVLNAAEDSYGIPRDLLARIAYQESGWQNDIIAGLTPSSAGALGLMQLMPGYFDTVRVPVPFSDEDTMAQIDQAAGQLRTLYTHFQSWPLAVAAYNAGQSTVDNYVAGTGSLLAQTQDYVSNILADVRV